MTDDRNDLTDEEVAQIRRDRNEAWGTRRKQIHRDVRDGLRDQDWEPTPKGVDQGVLPVDPVTLLPNAEDKSKPESAPTLQSNTGG